MSAPPRPPDLDAAMRAGSLETLRIPDVALSSSDRDFLSEFLFLDVEQARRAGFTAVESFGGTIYRGMAISDGQRLGQFVGVEPRRGVLLAEDPEQFTAMCRYFDQQLASDIRAWARLRDTLRHIVSAALIVMVGGGLLSTAADPSLARSGDVIATAAVIVMALPVLASLIGWHTLSRWLLRR